MNLTDPDINCAPPTDATPKEIQAHADQWFPHPRHEAKATRLCAGCPRLTECLAYAMSDLEMEGVFGGTSTAQRRAFAGGRPAIPLLGAGKDCGSRRGYEAHLKAKTETCRGCRDAWAVYKRDLRETAEDGAA